MKIRYFFYSTLCVLALAACSSSSVDSSFPGQGWEQDIQALRQRAQGTPYEEITMAILEDGRISEEELVEIESRHLTCVKERGVEGFTFDTHGGGLTGHVNGDSDAAARADEECQAQLGTWSLHGLFHSMRANPNKADQNTIIAACLVKLEVVDPSYTGTQFHEEYVGYMEANANSQGQVQGDPTQALSYTVDVEKGADALFTCMTQPETVLNLESQ